MQLFNDVTFAASVATLAAAVIDSAKGRGKIAAAFRDIAGPAYGDKAKQLEVAELLAATRREIQTKRESYCKWLSSNGQAANVDAFRKSVINAVTYAGKVAGDAAGCAFKYDQKTEAYSVEDKKAAGEKAPQTAAAKDANSAEQSAALVDAAEKAPIMAAADRQGHLTGILSSLLAAGYTLAEIEAAWHGMAGKRAADEKAAEVAASASEPQAPALLEKLEKLENKPRQNKRANKRAA